MVSAADPRAADAGAEMLRQGGSAADAAFATMLALNVVEPQSSGIGGGGYLVYSTARRPRRDLRRPRESAGGGDRHLVLEDGQPLAFSDAQPGGKSVGVPGNIRMMALAHAALRQAAVGGAVPARDQACARRVRGHSPAPQRAREISGDRCALGRGARASSTSPDGTAQPVGTRCSNPALGDFLDRLARDGPDSFYVGPNAGRSRRWSARRRITRRR